MPQPGSVITWQRVLLAGVVLALGSLLAWLDWHSDTPQTIDPKARAEEPGHVVKNAVLTLYDDQGDRYQQITTEQLTHTPQRHVTQMKSPRALLVDSQQREWHVQAHQGHIDDQGEHLVLRGDVRLTEPKETWLLITQRLEYRGANSHAFTDSPVTLKQPPQSVQAQQMDLWLDEDRLQLRGQVIGYHPTEKAP